VVRAGGVAYYSVGLRAAIRRWATSPCVAERPSEGGNLDTMPTGAVVALCLIFVVLGLALLFVQLWERTPHEDAAAAENEGDEHNDS
jgi:hypothetical protein